MFTICAGVLVRKPIPITDIKNVQSDCRVIDVDMRWLIALISDTGMRLAEGAGLLKRDFIGLDTDLLYVRVTKHPWRNLKTASSERKISLVGEALWAAKRIVEAYTASDFAFPRYKRELPTAANSASTALNKWLKQCVPQGCTMHSFRHSMWDRLRAAKFIRYYGPDRWVDYRWCRAGIWFRLSHERVAGLVSKSCLMVWSLHNLSSLRLAFSLECFSKNALI